MYGVPADLDLTGFHAATLIQIGIGEHTLHFVFQPPRPRPLHYLMVEGAWEIRDADGAIFDRVQEHPSRDAYRIHKLLSRDVVGSIVDAPRRFALRFGFARALLDSPGAELWR